MKTPAGREALGIVKSQSRNANKLIFSEGLLAPNISIYSHGKWGVEDRK